MAGGALVVSVEHRARSSVVQNNAFLIISNLALEQQKQQQQQKADFQCLLYSQYSVHSLAGGLAVVCIDLVDRPYRTSTGFLLQRIVLHHCVLQYPQGRGIIHAAQKGDSPSLASFCHF